MAEMPHLNLETCLEMNHSHNRDGVVRDKNGQLFNPVVLGDNLLVTTKFVCCFIGIPLNLYIAFTIIHRPRLHRKPRNIFLLGIIFSQLAFFVPAIINLIYWGLYSVEWVCQSYVALVCVPQGLLTLNMLLALVDRYIAINHPLVHKEKMTVHCACLIIISSSFIVVFLLKFIFIVGLVPLRCEMRLVHGKLVLTILSILSGACTVMNFVVYRQTKILLLESRRLNLATNKIIENGEEAIELTTIVNDSRNVRGLSVSDALSDRSTRIRSVYVNRKVKKLSQIELEATLTLISGVTSLIVTALPPTIFVSMFLGCQYVVGDCSNLNWMCSYLIELGLIHSMYSPFIYIARNKELRTTLSCQVYRG